MTRALAWLGILVACVVVDVALVHGALRLARVVWRLL